MMEVARKRIENVLVEHGCQRGLEPVSVREKGLCFSLYVFLYDLIIYHVCY